MVALLVVVLGACYLWFVEVRVGGGERDGGGEGDSSAARCWSIDPAREISIGIHGVRADLIKNV